MTTDLNKTLEQLENEIWQEPGYDSNLVITIFTLRKKPLKDYTTEDLRISIGQNCGLIYLIPLAIETLTKNILAEGRFYEGDLLKMVLDSDVEYWKTHKAEWSTVKGLFEKNRPLFGSDIYRQIRKSFEQFEKINN